jgi:protein SCO1/2
MATKFAPPQTVRERARFIHFGMPARRVMMLAMAAAVAACAKEAPLHGLVIEPPQEMPAVRITDARGARVDLDAERGARTVVLFFGYTHCPDVCPTTLADWAKANRALGRAAKGVRWVFVSVDPGRDTPEVAQRYATQFDSAFVGLSPTPAQLDSLQESWGFTVTREIDPSSPGAYAVSHPAGTFVIDRAGKIREILPPNTSGDAIASDLRRIR